MNDHHNYSPHEQVLIWSMYHEAWYKPSSAGYIVLVHLAGRWPRSIAEQIVKKSSERIIIDTEESAVARNVDGGMLDLANRKIAELQRSLVKAKYNAMVEAAEKFQKKSKELRECGSNYIFSVGSCNWAAAQLRDFAEAEAVK